MENFFVQPFVDTGLGNSAYLIGSHDTKKGILIDPLRDVDRYLHAVSELGLTLTHVLDTHLHADFVSGNREIAYRTGAVIGASADAKVGFDHVPLTEKSTIDLGAFQIHVMNTPGHTSEHISFLIVEPDKKAPSALFSGGALIVGGAARTDLLGHELSQPLARHLYHTIHDKLLKLPDELQVFPTHGAGSLCVVPTSSDRVTTVGRERRTKIVLGLSHFMRTWWWLMAGSIVGGVLALKSTTRRSTDAANSTASCCGRRCSATSSARQRCRASHARWAPSSAPACRSWRGSRSRRARRECRGRGGHPQDTRQHQRGQHHLGTAQGLDVFPPMVTQMVAVGEEPGALDEMLSKIADFYEDEVDAAVEAMTAVIEPAMIIIMGVLVTI